MINKQKLINTNKIFGERVANESSLDFDVDMANKQKNIFRQLAYATRAMTSSHAFSNANKRTALVMIKSELADVGIRCDQKKIAKSLVRLATTGEGRINIIERRIRASCRKKFMK
jgi:prophage maintenance system killer protein